MSKSDQPPTRTRRGPRKAQRIPAAGALTALVVGLSACGGDASNESQAERPSPSTSSTSTVATAPSAPDRGAPIRVGETQTLEEEYLLNGEPIRVRLRVHLIKVDNDAPSPDEFTKPEPGTRWVRIRAKLTNESDDALQQNIEDFDAVTEDGERFGFQGYPFKPSLGYNVADLAPGESIVGFAAAQVPRGKRVTEIRLGAAYAQALAWRR